MQDALDIPNLYEPLNAPHINPRRDAYSPGIAAIRGSCNARTLTLPCQTTSTARSLGLSFLSTAAATASAVAHEAASLAAMLANTQ